METLNLEKGQRISLAKEAPGLKVADIGLGWKANSGNGKKFDLDVFAFLLKDGKLFEGLQSIIYFGNRTRPGASLSEDNQSGEGEGDDEVLTIDFSKLPSSVNEVVIGVNIFEATERRQNFGMVNDAYIRIVDKATDQEILKYDLSEDHSTSTGMLMGKLYLKEGEWRFQATGNQVNGTIDDIANPYK